MGRDRDKNEYLTAGDCLILFMDRFQPIYDIAELCARKGLENVILSPGSRCAPLTLAFTRHKKINTKTISDERSAGFIALGIAQQTSKASILLCTSGSAAYNFAPAVAEAFFSTVPLIVFTADRPSEWIGQQDGQAIYQQGIYGAHVKKTFQFPQDYEHADSQWAINRMVNEAINLANQHPKGPVHINAPFREPLYPKKNSIPFSKEIRVIQSVEPSLALSETIKSYLQKEWSTFNKVLIVGGQQNLDAQMNTVLSKILGKNTIPIAGDILSNLHPIKDVVKYSDHFLGQVPEKESLQLQPDILITFGGQVISKNLKLFLRNYSPRAHWHILPAGVPADTFQHLTKIIYTDPVHFFEFLNALKSSEDQKKKQTNFFNLWMAKERSTEKVLQHFFPQPELGEIELVNKIIQQLPKSCTLHLANSMSVRYANFIGLRAKQNGVNVFANRGTSGIDGCTSTALGHSLASDAPNILITGDLAFFYDRNAFWNNYPVPNFRVVLLNNHGGIIFKMIDGPASLPEADEYFVTRQNLNARKLCEEFDFKYLSVDNKKDLSKTLNDFFTFDGTTKILELESEIEKNIVTVDKLKKEIKKSL